MSQTVRMENEVMAMIPGFIFSNARYSARGRPILEKTGVELTGTEPDLPVVVGNTRYARQLVICGAGPSLNPALSLLRRFPGDIWACNGALPYLIEEGVRVTHGCAIDQTPAMYTEKWHPPPAGIGYYLATSCHPLLFEAVLRVTHDVTMFHSFVGFDGEEDACGNLYESTLWSGDGYNVVNRMLIVALHLGYSRICIAGADCALGKNNALHFDGKPTFKDGYGNILTGEVDGREWSTHPDMALSAVDLVHQQRAWGPRIELWGDTLPNALRSKSAAFLEMLPKAAVREDHV